MAINYYYDDFWAPMWVPKCGHVGKKKEAKIIQNEWLSQWQFCLALIVSQKGGPKSKLRAVMQNRKWLGLGLDLIPNPNPLPLAHKPMSVTNFALIEASKNTALEIR